MKPTTEEAKRDLEDVRAELEQMRNILNAAAYLAARPDVDGAYYASIMFKVQGDISKGENVQRLILSKYPELV